MVYVIVSLVKHSFLRRDYKGQNNYYEETFRRDRQISSGDLLGIIGKGGVANGIGFYKIECELLEKLGKNFARVDRKRKNFGVRKRGFPKLRTHVRVIWMKSHFWFMHLIGIKTIYRKQKRLL